MKYAVLVFLLLTAAVSDAWPAGDLGQDAALRDTMSRLGPLMGHRWLEKNGLQDYLFRQSWKPTVDSGLACVGRWSYGPSVKVSLRVTPDDTIICLTRGSGASLIRFRSRDSVTLDLLGDLNFAGIPRRAVIQDTLVIAGIHSGGTGLEVHGVTNPASPNLLSRVDLPVVNDIAVKDSLVYVACEDDSLRIYSIANPRSPERVGACRDSCDLFMTQAGDYCYLVHVSGINIVDVSNPANPHRAGRITGGEPLAANVRDSLAYVMVYQYGLRVYNVRNVASPQQVGSLSRPNAFDLTMAATCDTALYTSLLDIISVSDPTQPRLVGHVDIPADKEYGIALVPALSHALVANYTDGVVAVDIRDPAVPAVDTTASGAGITVDIDIDGGRAYLASCFTGLSILDILDPTRPSRLGGVDVVGLLPLFCRSVVARDSFAYSNCWYQLPHFRSVNVGDPSRPELAGGADITNPPEDMVLRDSLVYVAEDQYFQVVNVALPRSPVLVGSCYLPGTPGKLTLDDSIAYAADHGVQCVSITDPAHPCIVGSYPNALIQGLCVRDTIVYGSGGYTGLMAFDMANPRAPRILDSLHLTDTLWWQDLVVVDTIAYLGGECVWAVDVSNPQDLRLLPGVSWIPPDYIERMVYVEPYIYVACAYAGVCILEMLPVGIAEPRKTGAKAEGVEVRPSVARGRVIVRAEGRRSSGWSVWDAAGRMVMQGPAEPATTSWPVDLSSFPPGAYWLEVLSDKGVSRTKLVRP